MSPGHAVLPIQNHRFPRVSGDEPLVHKLDTTIPTFSPRERG